MDDTGPQPDRAPLRLRITDAWIEENARLAHADPDGGNPPSGASAVPASRAAPRTRPTRPTARSRRPDPEDAMARIFSGAVRHLSPLFRLSALFGLRT